MGFKYKNLNPLGRHEKDCVCRAIALATNSDYRTVERKLYLIGELYDCEQLCVACYLNLIENFYECKRLSWVKGLTVEEFAKQFPKGTYIVRVPQHCTCVIDGNIMDIWDCSNEVVDIAWEAH